MLLFWVASDVLGDNYWLFVSMVAVVIVILDLQRHVRLPKEIKSLMQNSYEIPDAFFIVETSTNIITPNK